MAQINLNDVYTGENTQNTNSVGFFNLQNDGDEAVVRFMVDSIEDLEILTVHDIRVDGKFRQISCVRDPREAIDRCPLCDRGEKVKQVVFIKMLQYNETPNGVEVNPVVWQRSASTYAFRMKGYLDNYGPLSQILCKVIRHGARGDMQTTYDIIPNLNPTQFPQEKYPINAEAFKDYKALGRVVLDRSYDEINEFINTGKFPDNSPNNVDITPQPQYNTTTAPPNFEMPGSAFDEPMPAMQRPTRYY